MQQIFNFIFDNFLLVVGGLLIWYIIVQYRDLKDKTLKIKDLFDKELNKYIEAKVNEVKKISDEIKTLCGEEKEIETEMVRLTTIVEKGINGTITEKVETCNAINKYKSPKNIDLEEFPMIEKLNELGIFNEEDIDSEHDSVSIARREYNALAFRYNEKAISFPMNIITKLLRLAPSYKIFDPPKSSSYELNYEVFEEEEPEINSLTSLNRSVPTKTEDLNELMMKKEVKPQVNRALLNDCDKIVNPTLNMKEKESQYNTEYQR
jgi:hypothetical protein